MRIRLDLRPLALALCAAALLAPGAAVAQVATATLSGRVVEGAPTRADPFTGFSLPGAGASGINVIDPNLQNPMVQEFHLGVEQPLAGIRARVDLLHNRGRLLIGRTVGEVFNPVVGGPDRVVNIELSARTGYSALLVSFRARRTRGTRGTRRARKAGR